MQLQLFKGNAHIQKVTIRHLLSMRSGIKDYDGDKVSYVCTLLQLRAYMAMASLSLRC